MNLILVTNIKIENSIFKNNTAVTKDGTISIKLFKQVVFNNLEFYNNKAKDFATFTLETSFESINFSNLIFKNNQAERDCGWYKFIIFLLFKNT